MDNFFTLEIFLKSAKWGSEGKAKIVADNGGEDGVLKLLLRVIQKRPIFPKAKSLKTNLRFLERNCLLLFHSTQNVAPKPNHCQNKGQSENDEVLGQGEKNDLDEHGQRIGV